jgi:hypothetical protein
LLEEGRHTFNEITYKVGYEDISLEARLEAKSAFKKNDLIRREKQDAKS